MIKALPNLQRGGGGQCRNFAYYFMLIIRSWQPKGGAMAQCPPFKCAPAFTDCSRKKNAIQCFLLPIFFIEVTPKHFKTFTVFLLTVYDLLNFGAKNFISYFIKCNIGSFFENFRSYSKRFNLNYTYLKARYIIQMGRVIAAQSCKRADYFRPEPGPNPKTNLKPKSCPKKNKS